jgi:hypothetical protein
LKKLSEFVRPGGPPDLHDAWAGKSQNPDAAADSGRRWLRLYSESEQFDLSTVDYFHAVTYPKFVLREIEKLPRMDLNMFFKAFWWRHQDAYVLQKWPAQ